MDSSENSNSFGDDDESPFFADMTLDLAMAHDIAETPEPKRKQILSVDPVENLEDFPRMPPISDCAPESTGFAPVEEDSNINPNFDSREILTSITSEQTHGRFMSAKGTNSSISPSARRRPRDSSWALAFCIFVPVSLSLPMLFDEHTSSGVSSNETITWMSTTTAPRLATLHTLLWGCAASFGLSRMLYRTLGGGDGDDARHIASQVVLASAPLSVSAFICLILTMYFMTPKAWPYMIIPLWFLARDIYIFRQWKITSSTPGGRQAFFQALTCMALDILSRSLRRASFYRIVSALLFVQLVVVAWWRLALLAAMRSQSFFLLIMAAIGGKWATGTVARLLSLIASGGISTWFAEQNSLVEEMRQMTTCDEDDAVETIDFAISAVDNKSDDGLMPEAYRMTAASAYISTFDMDEGVDDNFEDEEDVQPLNGILPTTPNGSTVKLLLFRGLSISFGSVCKCGLVGGLAQFVWSQLRKIDIARATFGSGFQGMDIGSSNDDDENQIRNILRKSNLVAREFVRNHSDMAMSHVAAFQKSYHRAAQDVALLIDESGVEPIIHDDISTHISACVGDSITAAIVNFTGIILVHQKNRNSPNISDSAIILDMILAYLFCYTLIFTAMEPLRASIKAVYVSFAQQPQSISQSFPLIFHRLSRMSQSNLQ